MSSLVPATRTPWMRMPCLDGLSSTATTGSPHMFGSLFDMRLIAIEPVSPAPTMSVRGRLSFGFSDPNSCRLLFANLNPNRAPPTSRIISIIETK